MLLAVFNLCGDAAMSILIKRKLNNTMWLVCVGVICAPLGVHVIAILDAWLYRADLSKLTKCNKAVVALALFFSLPALDGLALALPWPDRAHEGFPTARYSKASLVRAAQDAVMLLLKLVFYQAYAGFSALAMVLSVFSLVSLVLHARRAQKIWPAIFVRNRNRNARSDTEMTRAVAVPEVPMATAVPAGDVPLPAVPKSPPAPAPAPPPALSSWEDQSEFAGDVAAPPPPAAPPAPAASAAARASAGAAAGRQAGAAPGWRPPPPPPRAAPPAEQAPTPAGRVCVVAAAFVPSEDRQLASRGRRPRHRHDGRRRPRLGRGRPRGRRREGPRPALVPDRRPVSSIRRFRAHPPHKDPLPSVYLVSRSIDGRAPSASRHLGADAWRSPRPGRRARFHASARPLHTSKKVYSVEFSYSTAGAEKSLLVSYNR